MSEFNNRIKAQRDVLEIVNDVMWNEELLGLSSGAIDRWVVNNQLDVNQHFVKLIKEVAAKLFFLANKSQEQITQEYLLLSDDVLSLTNDVKHLISQVGFVLEPT